MPSSTPFGCDISAQDTQRPEQLDTLAYPHKFPQQLDTLAIRTRLCGSDATKSSNWTYQLSAQEFPSNWTLQPSAQEPLSTKQLDNSHTQAGLCQAQNTILKQHQLGKEGYDKSPTQRTTWPSPSKGCYPPPQSTGGLIQRTSKSKSAPTRGARHCRYPKGYLHSPSDQNWSLKQLDTLAIRTRLSSSNWTLQLSAQEFPTLNQRVYAKQDDGMRLHFHSIQKGRISTSSQVDWI